ncbi:MAG: glycosyltransferase [Lachnospiraceae bacterium]|nr:glycosyltransferase [Lachnospiraceae bacterium]
MYISKKPILSVIIPVFNVENYLEKCINSVRNQTIQNIEIILIDDGSTDNSGELCNKLALQDKRIVVVHQKNGGLSVARNTGLEIANGEWIAFLDSDDWISQSMYKKLIDCCINNSCDVSFCDSVDVEEIESIINHNNVKGNEKIIEINDYLSMLINKDKARIEVWNKVWKRELIGKTRFIPGHVSEDIHFNREILQKVDKIAYVPEQLHYYLVQRPGSTSTSFKVKRLYAFQEYSTWIVDYYTKNEYYKKNLIAATAANFAIAIYLDSIKNNAPKNSLKLIQSYYKMYKQQVEEKRLLSLKHNIFSISPCIYSFLIKLRG